VPALIWLPEALEDTGRRQVFTAFGAGDYVLRYPLNHNGDPVIIRVWHSREARK